MAHGQLVGLQVFTIHQPEFPKSHLNDKSVRLPCKVLFEAIFVISPGLLNTRLGPFSKALTLISPLVLLVVLPVSDLDTTSSTLIY